MKLRVSIVTKNKNKYFSVLLYKIYVRVLHLYFIIRADLQNITLIIYVFYKNLPGRRKK